MEKVLRLVAILFCFTLMSSCTGTKKAVSITPPVLQPSSLNGTGIVYQVPGMDKINVKRDITYKEDRGEELKFDIYYPSGKTEGLDSPTVVLIHGLDKSNPNLKDTSIYESWGRVLGADGFNAVIFNWRPDASTGDVSDILKYIREHSKKLKINVDNIKVIAFSMGVEEGINEVIRTNTGFVKSIVVFYGMVDPRILKMSAAKLPPMFFAMGGKDTVRPENINDSFIKEATDMGNDITKAVNPDGQHGFDVFNNIDGTKDIIDKAIMFIINDGAK